MYKLNVESHFSSAHQLVGYDGPCQNVHGHNWKVRACLLCDSTDDIGLTVDFGIVKKHLEDVMNMLDHKFLNQLDCFEGVNPTSENIAKFIYSELSKELNQEGCKVHEVEVWESEKSSITYFE